MTRASQTQSFFSEFRVYVWGEPGRFTRYMLPIKNTDREKQNECHRKESAATHSWPKGHCASALAIISSLKGQGGRLHFWGVCRLSRSLKMTIAPDTNISDKLSGDDANREME